MVIATDAPVDARNLERMAARAMMRLGRTGAAGGNGSGDYSIAFPTSPDLRIRPLVEPSGRNLPHSVKVLPNDAMSAAFLRRYRSYGQIQFTLSGDDNNGPWPYRRGPPFGPHTRHRKYRVLKSN